MIWFSHWASAIWSVISAKVVGWGVGTGPGPPEWLVEIQVQFPTLSLTNLKETFRVEIWTISNPSILSPGPGSIVTTPGVLTFLM